MKQLFTRTTLLFVFLLSAITASADSFEQEVDGIYYRFYPDGDTCSVIKGKKWYSGDIVIRPKVRYNGVTYNVTSIGLQAFFGCTSLTSVNIPNSVTAIKLGAFESCSSLISINIPNSVTAIEANAFSHCSSLTNINIPNSVTSIGSYAFYGCNSLTKVNIPNSVTAIGLSAFWECSSLKTVSIPNSVTYIGSMAFSECSSMTEINVSENNENFKSIDGVLFDKNATMLIAFPCGKGGEYTIPNSVTTIGSGAFWGCSSLTGISIPNSVTAIGSAAFNQCSSLTIVNIPNSVTAIGSGAFWGCSSLTIVNIPNSVTTIGNGVFTGCSSLTEINVSENNESFKSIDGVLFDKNATMLIAFPGGKGGEYTIPNSVTTIGDDAFSNCSSLTNANIPNSVTYIGSRAFWKCSSLTSVNIPNSVTYIYSNAFIGCSMLTEINVTEDNDNFKSIDGVLFNKNATILLTFPCGKRGEYTIPNTVKSIGEFAFLVCSALTSVNIPNSVTSIEYIVFGDCKKLNQIYSFNPIPPKISFNTFDFAIRKNATLFVPKGSLNAYWDGNWNFNDIKEFDPSDIAQTKIDGFGFAITNNGLTLSGVDGKPVSIFTADGRQAYATAHYAGEPITLPHGLYIVKAGGKVMKVAVK